VRPEILIQINNTKARAMEGMWTNNSFTTLETRAMMDAITMYKRKQPIEW
jgi:hypothetical protein